MSGTALGRAGERVGARRRPTRRSGAALARRARRSPGCSCTELAHDGDRAARDVRRADRRCGSASGIANLVNVFNPEVVVVGGGVDRGGRPAARAGARGRARARAARRRATTCEIVAARFGEESGMLGAALLALDGLGPARRRGGMSAGRLVVCPTPIGNLEDVTLRVLAALRDADVVACEDTRRTRVLLDRYGVDASLVSYHEHNERARAAELVARMAGGRGRRAGVRRGDAAGERPGLRARHRRASRRAWRSRCCRGRARRWPRWWRAALPAESWRFVGLPAAQGGRSSRRCWRSPETRRGVRVAAAARRRRWRRSPSVDADAAGRGLPRADEAPRGGRARRRPPSWPRATRPRSRAARSSSSSAPRRPRRPTARPGGRRGARGSSRRARGRGPAAGGRRASSPACRPTRSTARSRRRRAGVSARLRASPRRRQALVELAARCGRSRRRTSRSKSRWTTSTWSSSSLSSWSPNVDEHQRARRRGSRRWRASVASATPRHGPRRR